VDVNAIEVVGATSTTVLLASSTCDDVKGEEDAISLVVNGNGV
jgi:hypothetical protein